MARKTKPTTPDAPAMSRTEWALAFVRKVDELRPNTLDRERHVAVASRGFGPVASA